MVQNDNEETIPSVLYLSHLFVKAHRNVIMSHLSSVQPPEVYEINGIKFMKILGIVISLPPPESEVYKEYLKCNNFCLFRKSCTEALKGYDIDPKEISRIAADCWEVADKNFKTFFTKYANAIFKDRKTQVIKIKNPYVYNAERITKRRTRKPNKKKPSKMEIRSKEAIDELSVGQESLMSKRYQEDISNFEIIDTSPPSELPSSSYSSYINEAKRAEEISFQPLYDFE
ncbi:unnamed protein product [Rhizophagus irregularis]|uniref:MATA-HMG n=2 Tax=Rhizophagus irregularis TaxID=588596 RepID=A0A2N1MXU8_9GLOM|nr:hypothetical protein RhiirC2_852903 [Rhizophagus irregularis]CAB4389823.1 unnamed protein product [Rhizophagus irregularis]CAB5367111.1 unnamed protein product [Rhizophagus irregularis]